MSEVIGSQFKTSFMSAFHKNRNHPKKGSTIKVEPIRMIDDIAAIKNLLAKRPRDLCFFVLGINTAYRASELLSITCGQVAHLQIGDQLNVWQSKTSKRRVTALNGAAIAVIQEWLRQHPNPAPNAPLFISRNGKALTVSTVSTMVKGWCREVGVIGNYGSHTLRKTWGYHRLRDEGHRGTRFSLLPMLVVAFGHATQQQTLDYLCVQDEEVADLYLTMEL